MPTVAGKVRRRLLTPDMAEATFAKRRFHARDPLAKFQLERSGTAFLTGFGHAMASRDMAEARLSLDGVERPFRGFAYEGAGMAFALTDAITPWRRTHVRRFLAGPAAPHIYMAYVGIGWAMARLPRPLWRAIALPDPLLRWLAMDGYGFHQAYFATERFVTARRPIRVRPPWPDRTGYAGRAADQGVGRALWFVCGGDVERLGTVLGGYAEARRPDLWSGAGLAAAYAGGADPAGLETMRKIATGHRRELAQGAAFAAQARLRAGLLGPHTEAAAQVFCGCSAEVAAARTRWTLAGLPPDRAAGPEPAYEVWRRRIRECFRDAGEG